MIKKRFFFVTTYDHVTGGILYDILSQINSIHCSQSKNDRFSNESYPSTCNRLGEILDTFIEVNSIDSNKFNGNIQKFTSFELHNKIITEKSKSPLYTVQIATRPEFRVKAIIMNWVKNYGNAVVAANEIRNKFESLKYKKDSLFTLLHFNNYHEIVCKALKNSNSKSGRHNDILFSYAFSLVLAMDSANFPTTSEKFSINDIANDENTISDLLKKLTGENLALSENELSRIRKAQSRANSTIDEIDRIQTAETHLSIIKNLTQAKLHTIYYPHLNNPLSYYYNKVGYDDQTTRSAVKYDKLISIQLNSNRPTQLISYFDNIQDTCNDYSKIEILVNIDDNDAAMEETLRREIKQRPFTIKYIKTARPKSFCDLWEPINHLLSITDPGAYFLLNISDEMFFAVKGWDTILDKYVGFFEDGIFRLRASRNKLRNYFDRWECSFAQDAIPITTKKWVDIGGDWNPCFGPDSYQQLISFYLSKDAKFTNNKLLRDIPIFDIDFFGDVPAIGIEENKRWKHIRDHILAMQICQSYPMQLEANRRAMMLKAHIIANEMQLDQFEITIDTKKKNVILKDNEAMKVIMHIPYKLSRFKIRLENQFRKLYFFAYFGDGLPARKSFPLGYLQYLKSLYSPINTLYHIVSVPTPKRIIRFIKNKPKIKLMNLMSSIYKKRINPLKNEVIELRNLYTNVCIENERLNAILNQINSKQGEGE